MTVRRSLSEWFIAAVVLCCSGPAFAQERPSQQELANACVTLGRLLYQNVTADDLDSARSLVRAYQVAFSSISDDDVRRSIERTTNYVNAVTPMVTPTPVPRPRPGSLSGAGVFGNSYISPPGTNYWFSSPPFDWLRSDPYLQDPVVRARIQELQRQRIQVPLVPSLPFP